MTDRVADVLTAQGGRLLGFFINRLENADEAPDLLGDVFLIAWRRRRDLPADADQARMWLFGVARKVLANHRRGKGRRQALDARLREHLIACVEVDQFDGVAVRAAVRSLPPRLAELTRLVAWDGLTLEEAARHLGIPASTARSRYARARSLLGISLAIRT